MKIQDGEVGMTYREKVIKAIENCIGQPKCKDCPWEDCEVEHDVVNNVPYGLMCDTLALLKEQQKLIDEITQRRANNGAFD